MTPDLKRYFEFHDGVKVIGNQVVITTKCSMLDNNNKCKIHYRGKPDVCKVGPHNNGGYFITEGCLLKDGK